MAQLRKDPITSRWIIVDAENPLDASSFPAPAHKRSSRLCPFCPGNEAMTPPSIRVFEKKTSSGASWMVRVIPNKFPALRIEESTEPVRVGMYDKVGGFGAHEVIIETPEHGKEMADLPQEHLALVLRTFRERCLDLRKDKRFKYILIFKNYGAAAGASLEHPHSQLIALPIIPSRVMSEIEGAETHFEYTDRCIFCDMMSQEQSQKKLVVASHEGFISMAPFASRFPFETWILPERHEASFDSISDHDVDSLAKILKNTLLKLKTALNDPCFNFMINTAPIDMQNSGSYHWHIEIIPHLTKVAGFELGTGFYVNPTSPELAAATLRRTAPLKV